MFNVGALSASATDRLCDLARPKRLHSGYQSCRNVEWKVSSGAYNAVATTRFIVSALSLSLNIQLQCMFSFNRLHELATPIIRDTMDHVQFNPEAFKVSQAAKQAKASARIEELAQPIQR